MNNYLQNFIDRAQGRYNVDRDTQDLGDWICENTRLRNKPFSFSRYPFQQQIVNDLHPNMDVIKPSQVGLTEIQIRKALALLMRNPGISLIFTLPNEKMYKRISKARIKPLVTGDRAFQNPDGTQGEQSMGLMKIGSSFLYVTGSSEADATSIDADIIFNDEIDLSDQDMISLFNSRLQGSDMRINQRFSTPTYEGYGIHKGFLASDQHQYLAKCKCCGHYQMPEFNRKFVRIKGLPDYVQDLQDIDEKLLNDGVISLDTSWLICERCQKPLDLSNHDEREWVAKYPTRTHARGYEVSPFSTERLDIPYILGQLFKYKRSGNMKGFNNTVLGKPHNDIDSRLSEVAIEYCFTTRVTPPPYEAGEPYWLGIDMGATCHIVVARGRDPSKLHYVLFETCTAENAADRVVMLRERYRIEAGGSDRHPYTPTSNDIRNKTNGAIVPVEYRGSKDINKVEDAFGNVSHVQVNRTTVIDAVAQGIRSKLTSFSGYGTDRATIIAHLRDMIRDSPQEGEARWLKLTGEDHYFHAMAFLISGMIHKGVLTYTADYQHIGDTTFVVPEAKEIQTGTDLIGFSNGYESNKNGVIVTRHRY
jgi:hypothetical protein